MAHFTAKSRAWWNLTVNQRVLLNTERAGGRFGGENALGAGRAPYAWVQEYGCEAASIRPQHYMSNIWMVFLRRADDVLERSFHTLGTMKRG